MSILERSYQSEGVCRELMTKSLLRKLKWPVATQLTLPLGSNFTHFCQQIKGMRTLVNRGGNHRKCWHRGALKEILPMRQHSAVGYISGRGGRGDWAGQPLKRPHLYSGSCALKAQQRVSKEPMRVLMREHPLQAPPGLENMRPCS